MSTILLVDDDPLHASVRKAILERKFSCVLRAGDAAEALCLVEQPQVARDLTLVISSDHLSGIGLASFVSELHTRMPDVPVLVIGEKEKNDADLTGFPVQFLKRPVTADDMLSAVSKLLANWTPRQLKTA